MISRKYLIGTSGWTYDHWKGNFYPSELTRKNWFNYYTDHFDTVEINATFYRRFEDQTYLNWAFKAPEHFQYVLKVPRIITHRKFLRDCELDIREFWRSAKLLREKLGLLLLQLSPQIPFAPGLLKKALSSFNDPKKVAVEFRNESWLNQETYNLLKKIGVVFCNVDSPRFSFIEWTTSDIAYIRLHGRKRWYSYNYTDHELEEIAEAARQLNNKGARKVYVFFNNDFEGYAPRNALRLIEILS